MTSDSTPAVLGPLAGGGVAAVEAELVELYAACYAAPPWSEGAQEVAAYRLRLAGWAAESTFAGLLARHPAGVLIGAVYGWSGPPEVGGARLPGIDHEHVFHVGDLMVHPRAQRQGLGRALLDRLAADRLPAVLLTHADSGARHLYDAMGWRLTGTVEASYGPPLLVYARP